MSERAYRYSGLIAAVLIALALATAVRTTAAGQHNDYQPDAVVVKLNPADDVRAFAAANGLRSPEQPADQLAGHAIYRLKIADGDSPTGKAGKLMRRGRALYAEPNYLTELPEARQRSIWAIGGDTGAYVAQWAPQKMRLPEAQVVSTGAGVTVAILDTGADLGHPALAAHLMPGYDFVAGDADPSEEGEYRINAAYGHGTHVAGLVALAAPGAKIMPLRTLTPDGVGTIWDQVQALRYAVDHGADVINLSFSYGQESQLMDDILKEVTCSSQKDSDCRASVRPGAVVVAAAGNSGLRVREYPAADESPGILAVGASTASDRLAAFSTYGSWVPVAAPGEEILSTIPGGGYATWSGTSMSAPLAAGAVALLRAATPGLRPAEAVSRVVSTAASIDSTVKRRVDAAAALGVGRR